ncbi:hypothetical protein F4861DRAFT_312887 [Xylaria intraflava]|nr:hypothetical protein F4861DRAFT_312887 [Xylaria intraflava]
MAAPGDEDAELERFRPTNAAEENNSSRRDENRKPQVTNRALLSKDWRQKDENQIQSPSGFQTRKASYPNGKAAISDVLLRMKTGVSPHYRGNPTLASNQSADIPNSENTSLWVTGLPRKGFKYHELMDMLLGRGKILASNIMETKSYHRSGAVTITFFRHVDAENVKRAINDGTLRVPVVQAVTEGNADGSADGNVQGDSLGTRDGELTLTDLRVEQTASTSTAITVATSANQPGLRLSAYWNRIRVAERKFVVVMEVKNQKSGSIFRLPSRVIHVKGKTEDVNPDSLQAFFSSKLRYGLDRVIYHGVQDDGLAEYEYRFACWRNQAEFARKALQREKPDIEWWFGVDPCEVVEDFPILNSADPETEVGLSDVVDSQSGERADVQAEVKEQN